jgi:hypothetical protein
MESKVSSAVWVTGGFLIGPEGQQAPFSKRYALDPVEVLGPERSRRLDPLSQNALMAVERACHLAGLSRGPVGERKPLEGVTVGSALGATVTSVRYARRLVNAGPAATNPIDFPDSIDGSAAAHVALDRGLCGPSVTFCDGERSALSALAYGARLVARGRVERMLVVCGDCLDEVFVKALTREAQETGRAYAEAVFALVLERGDLRPPPPHTLELIGFLPMGDVNSERDDTRRVAPTAERVDPSGVLPLARGWLSAVGFDEHRVGDWQPEPLEAIPEAEQVRRWWVGNADYPHLSFRSLSPGSLAKKALA